MINYHNKKFTPIETSENGEVSHDTVFHYQQSGDIVTCTYSGKHVQHGHLIAKVDEVGNLDIRYHQINSKGELMTGVCHTKPEVMSNGKIRLHEDWYWTSGDKSKGESILEEI